MLETTGRDAKGLLPFLIGTTGRLLATAETIGDEAIRAPSLLPGWSRAHVLAHIAGSTDSRVRLLVAAAARLDIPQYPSEQARTEQIEADAARPRAALLARVRRSLTEAVTAVLTHPADRWNEEVEWLGGDRHPVHRAVSSLLQELEVHHVDLDAGYRPADWPGWFVADESRRVLASFSDRPEMPRIEVQATDQDIGHVFGEDPELLVTGAGYALLAWLTGRSGGEGLSVAPPGPLPELPAWKQ